MTFAKGHLSKTKSQVSDIRTIGPLVCDCTGQIVSDLVGNPMTGFLTACVSFVVHLCSCWIKHKIQGKYGCLVVNVPNS